MQYESLLSLPGIQHIYRVKHKKYISHGHIRQSQDFPLLLLLLVLSCKAWSTSPADKQILATGRRADFIALTNPSPCKYCICSIHPSFSSSLIAGALYKRSRLTKVSHSLFHLTTPPYTALGDHNSPKKNIFSYEWSPFCHFEMTLTFYINFSLKMSPHWHKVGIFLCGIKSMHFYISAICRRINEIQ